jgi:hypothetical protein
LYHLRLQPSEIQEMPYYEFEYILENLIDILEKKKEAEEGQDEGAKEKQSSMMSQAKGMMPNIGSGKYSTPSMPSFPSMPSNLKI